jgi:hypothetical protein
VRTANQALSNPARDNGIAARHAIGDFWHSALTPMFDGPFVVPLWMRAPSTACLGRHRLEKIGLMQTVWVVGQAGRQASTDRQAGSRGEELGWIRGFRVPHYLATAEAAKICIHEQRAEPPPALEVRSM